MRPIASVSHAGGSVSSSRSRAARGFATSPLRGTALGALLKPDSDVLQQLVDAARGDAHVLGHVLVAVELRAQDDDPAEILGHLLQLLQRGEKLHALLVAIGRVRRFARRAELTLLALPDDPHDGTAAFRRQPPGLALRDSVQPAFPLTIAIGLVAEELHPRKRRRVLEDLGRAVDPRRELANELGVDSK